MEHKRDIAPTNEQKRIVTARSFQSSAVANWQSSFLVLLVLLLLLLLQKTRQANRDYLTEAESLHNEAIALRRRIPASATSAPPSAPVSAKPAKTKPPKSGGLASFSDDNAIADPEVGAAIVRRHRRYAMANYREAIDSLQLAPDKKDRLKQLVAERWTARTDVSDILHRQGEWTPEVREKSMAAAIAEANRQIQELLGPDGMATLEATYDEQSMKRINWSLFTAAWDAGVPLTENQQTLVARAMLQADKRFSSPAAANELDPSGLSRSDLALLELTKSFLSSEQVAVILADKIGNAEYRSAVHEAEQRKRSEAGGSAP